VHRVIGIVIALLLIAGALCFPTISARSIKSERTVSRPSSVATHAPANENEQISVLVTQAPGEEITVSLLAATAPLGYALADPLAQTPAQASILILILIATTAPLGYALADPAAQAPAQASILVLILIATVAPLGYAPADPLAQAPAQASILVFVSVSAAADPVADPTPQILPVLKKVGDEVPQILPRPYPVHQEIARIAVRIAIFVAPSLS
jgi:hypothetical protein